MADLLLGPLLRFVSETEATIWVETDEACTVSVLDAAAPTWEVAGHHYALVIVDGLEPSSTTTYEVELDGERRWPLPDSTLPPSSIRTLPAKGPLRLLVGSCRASAPHTEPYVRDADESEEGKGVDALRANGLRMLEQSPREWPDALVFLGDQIYADDASPDAKRRMDARAKRVDRSDVPDGVVADFEEYTWLYRESWSPEIERWMMSVVPSVMIFDDHDVIDDWNTSEAWILETRKEPWWQDHIVGAMESYWIHQHLGNRSPAEIRSEGMLARFEKGDDAATALRDWALDSEDSTPVPGGYRFSTFRRFGDVHLVMVDVRNGRVLTEQDRRIVDPDEWEWVRERCGEPCRHLIIATPLPVFTPGGIHPLQQWDEAICQGAWGRPGRWLGEKVRRALDTEHWPAFDTSFREMEQLLIDVGSGDGAPETISVLGGDIHFSYVIDVERRGTDPFTSRVHQIISSPIRNILARNERQAMRFAESKAGRRVGEFLARRAGRGTSQLKWGVDVDPIFDNTMAQLRFDGADAHVEMERALLVDGVERLEVFNDVAL